MPPVSSVFDGEILLLRDLWIPVNLQLSGGVFKYLSKNSSCWYFKTSILHVFPGIFISFYLGQSIKQRPTRTDETKKLVFQLRNSLSLSTVGFTTAKQTNPTCLLPNVIKMNSLISQLSSLWIEKLHTINTLANIYMTLTIKRPIKIRHCPETSQ